MFLIPYDRVEIRTPLTARQIEEILTPFIGRRTFAEYFKKPQYQFGGTLTAGRFKMHRHVAGRNSYLPVIRGELHSSPEGAVVKLSFQIHWVVVLFLLFMCGMSAWWHDPVPLIMVLVLHFALYFIGYLPEKNWAETWLRSKLKAQYT